MCINRQQSLYGNQNQCQHKLQLKQLGFCRLNPYLKSLELVCARGDDSQIARFAVSAFLLAIIYGLASPQVALAAGVDLAVICPSGGSSEPSLQDPQTGSTVPITDQKLRAVAAKACGSPGPVQIANGRTNAIFVAFTNSDHQLGPITWGSGRTQVAGGAVIGAGMTCSATVSSSAGSKRFCAVNVFPAVLNGTLAAKNGVTMDCFNAQANNQTMVETTFQPNGPSCFNQGNCVWYDIRQCQAITALSDLGVKV